MSLFTDGSIANLNDLRAYESSILDLATAEAIDLGSKLAVAQRELGFDVLAFLSNRSHHAAGSPLHGFPKHRRELMDVVATEPMLHTHVLYTLALIYRDLCNRQLNDRYQAKWSQYTELAKQAKRQLFEIGVGITNSPLPKPHAPAVDLVAGYGFATTYTVSAAIIGPSGFSSAPSDPASVEAKAGTTLRVTLGSLPPGATGFVLYASSTISALSRQTEQPLAANAMWSPPADGLRNDLPDITVQTADQFISNRQLILRG